MRILVLSHSPVNSPHHSPWLAGLSYQDCASTLTILVGAISHGPNRLTASLHTRA